MVELFPLMDTTSKPDTKLFYSIEYHDEEGPNIKHAFMTEIEMMQLLDEFVQSGLKAKIYRLSTLPTDVQSESEKIKEIS
jgi:hypothetical protein